MLRRLLASSNYCTYNKELGKRLTPIASIILSILCSKNEYYESQNQLTNVNGKPCFYCSRQWIEEDTGISVHQQRTAMKLLQEHKILEVFESIGVPARNYYYINEKALEKFLLKEE